MLMRSGTANYEKKDFPVVPEAEVKNSEGFEDKISWMNYIQDQRRQLSPTFPQQTFAEDKNDQRYADILWNRGRRKVSVDEEALDMCKELVLRKKKIWLKEKKFDYKSQGDVLAYREEGKEVLEFKTTQQLLLMEKTQEEREKKAEEMKEEDNKMKSSKIKGY
mmetsp:Transcript_22884/g.22162  ORF Transcript_22884/g.22162 Transcript_22884/m.22162 type:complete len:163 (+) Transcript_22884:844-1332(+)